MKIKDEIEEVGRQRRADVSKEYFNFGLTTNTWNMFVNKQLLMKYERLFIERQLNEKANKEKELNNELKRLDAKINEVRQ